MKIALTNVNSESITRPVRLKWREPVFCLLSTFLLFCLVISPAAAMVTQLTISPSHPGVGDIVTVTGRAFPGEKINTQITLNQRVPVSGGRYQLFVDDIKVLADTNTRFTVTAYAVRNLHVKVKKMGITIADIQSQAFGGIATISKSNVIPTTYDVLMSGDPIAARSSAVLLMITGSHTLTADSSGRFATSVDTSSMPPGRYTIRVGNMQRSITLSSGEHGQGNGQWQNGLISRIFAML